MLALPFLERAIQLVSPTAAVYIDTVDSLVTYVTSMTLLVFATVVGAKQHLGQPIQCWVPHEYYSGWEQYVEDYCFVQGTYFVSPDEIPLLPLQRHRGPKIDYYQWVPIVLSLQALSFYMPYLAWKYLCWTTPPNLYSTFKEINSCTISSGDIENESISEQLRATLNSRLFSGAIMLRYLLFKCIALIHMVGQLIFLKYFVTEDSIFWGFSLANSLAQGLRWKQTGIFPRVVMCDYELFEMGSGVSTRTAQCVLMINLYHEKILLCLSIWLTLCVPLLILNMGYWLAFSLSHRWQNNMLLRLRRQSDYDLESDTVMLSYGPDATFLLHCLEDMAGLSRAQRVSKLMANRIRHNGREHVAYVGVDVKF